MVIRQTGSLRRTVRSRRWLVLALLACSPATAVAAIVNSDVAVQSIFQNTLRAIFTLHLRQWPNGKPIKRVVLPETNMVHAWFAQEVLNTFPHQFKRSWDVLVFSGSGRAPAVTGSPGEMLQEASSTPGAIGCLSNNYLTEGIRNENIHLLEPC